MMPSPERISGNIFIRPNLGQRGELCAGHRHQFDHTTLFLHGSMRMVRTSPTGHIDDKTFVAPDHCLILADHTHEITHLGQSEETRPPHVRALLAAAADAGLSDAVQTFINAEKVLPSEFWCIYSHRDPQAKITQEYRGWDRAYT